MLFNPSVQYWTGLQDMLPRWIRSLQFGNRPGFHDMLFHRPGNLQFGIGLQVHDLIFHRIESLQFGTGPAVQDMYAFPPGSRVYSLLRDRGCRMRLPISLGVFC